eukprot:CAMPEP_0177181422 /NCGR_PEP_ID=MMETSP0367-20130122/15917_1 /TAXON_ID=447022 ORGANISM="Scrippsiella hangoei-like, Strain SHHI-4" /NCGR_SAMPLE_ID=MMETSP0367 /ASSEMBLY_ACC=CAM_ASM_000362 /LENGTH=165 /DNA_ID=CAMNT_0018628273 /DNA_START=203 /DNA_END=700 /DNA_ORIENTATION=-
MALLAHSSRCALTSSEAQERGSCVANTGALTLPPSSTQLRSATFALSAAISERSLDVASAPPPAASGGAATKKASRMAPARAACSGPPRASARSAEAFARRSPAWAGAALGNVLDELLAGLSPVITTSSASLSSWTIVSTRQGAALNLPAGQPTMLAHTAPKRGQ